MSSKPSIELDHIGIAVTDHMAQSQFWKALGWDLSGLETEVVPDQKVDVAFLDLKNSSRIELLKATDPSSPISKFLDKRGPGIHHICLRVKGIDQILKTLKDAGVRLINETPVMGAHHCRVAFVHPASTGGVLIELSEKQGAG